MRGEVVVLRRAAPTPQTERSSPCRSRLRDALCAGRVDEFIEETIAETAAPRPRGNVVGLLRAMGGRVPSPLSALRRLCPHDVRPRSAED
ncbi:hypothetical protein [Methylopila sp. 73B]|uniref:hypothetical protein n=1 Tax=Methylopila sp. 73B TaxID=1120792 RepID=UPI00037D044B|nr:hypothetical protein [Methylopila sp. 73B]